MKAYVRFINYNDFCRQSIIKPQKRKKKSILITYDKQE